MKNADVKDKKIWIDNAEYKITKQIYEEGVIWEEIPPYFFTLDKPEDRVRLGWSSNSVYTLLNKNIPESGTFNIKVTVISSGTFAALKVYRNSDVDNVRIYGSYGTEDKEYTALNVDVTGMSHIGLAANDGGERNFHNITVEFIKP